MVKKISVIGAGAVGSHVAYQALAHFNLEQLVLVDIAGDLARGIAFDLEDTRSFLGFSTKVSGTQNLQKIKNSDIVVITAGLPRKEGMTRYDLARTNAGIASELSAWIRKYAPAAIVIVITNPLDFITYVVRKKTAFPRERVIGMGSSLDAARFDNQIFNVTRVNPSAINSMVMGLHSKDMVPLAAHSGVGPVSLKKLLPEEKVKEVKDRVKMRGKEIVGYLKKGSAFFAPALSCWRILDAIIHDRHDLICASVLLKGEYGVKDICAGVPCLIGRQGIVEVIEVPLSPAEKKEFLKARNFFKECMTSL